MFHYLAQAPKGEMLCRDVEELRALWLCFQVAFADALAMCVMFDHVHLLLPAGDQAWRVSQAESAYARWRNHHRQTSGAVFGPAPPVEQIPPKQYARMIRYVLLNPCRAGYARDPLAWPWSTHRDRIGLAFPRLGPLEANPERFHGYVSRDDSVDPAGTPLPVLRSAPAQWADAAAAARAVLRAPVQELKRRGETRTLAVRTAWIHEFRDVEAITRETGLSRSRVYELVDGLPVRGGRIDDPALAAAVLVLGDRRFLGLNTAGLPFRLPP
jgi:hypothetical protein